MRALTSPSHLILSFSLFTSTKEATKSLPSSLLVVLVVHHRRLLTEKQRPFIARQRPLSAIYGSSKALNEGQSVSSKGERRQGSKGGQKISCPLRTPILCNFDRFTISTKCYPSSTRSPLCISKRAPLSYTAQFIDWHKSTTLCMQRVWLVSACFLCRDYCLCHRPVEMKVRW